MKLETDRLLLRPWRLEDAESLYQYAKDSSVGPAAGWPAHQTVEESRHVIETVLSSKETYAICLKENNEAIGSIGLMIGEASAFKLSSEEAEIGYWVGAPFWGQGLMPEAVREIIRYAFENLSLKQLWCGYYEGNHKSQRVQEKCGFTYHHTVHDVPVPLLEQMKTEHITYLTKDDWKQKQLTIKEVTSE